MDNLETGIIVTVGVIIVNLIIFSLIPIGIKTIIKKCKGKPMCLPK